MSYTIRRRRGGRVRSRRAERQLVADREAVGAEVAARRRDEVDEAGDPSPDVESVTVAPSMCGIGFGPKLCSDWLCGSPPYQTPSCDVSP